MNLSWNGSIRPPATVGRRMCHVGRLELKGRRHECEPCLGPQLALLELAGLSRPALAGTNDLLGLLWGLNHKFVGKDVYQLRSSLKIRSVIL